MSFDLYPKLCLLFPDEQRAQHYAMRAGAIAGLVISVVQRVVEIEGADHPDLRSDLTDAARVLGGDPIPERHQFQ